METEFDDDELLTTKQTAKLLDVKPETLEIWRHHGRYALAYVKVGRNVRYRRSTVMAFINTRTVYK